MEATKWSYPGPVTGSLYDQDPILMDKFQMIRSEKNRVQAEEQRRQSQKNKPKVPLSQRGR